MALVRKHRQINKIIIKQINLTLATKFEQYPELLATLQNLSPLPVTVCNLSFFKFNTKNQFVVNWKLEIPFSVTAALDSKLSRAHGFFQVDLIILFTFKCTLVELIAELIIIIAIIIKSNILCCSVYDVGVQAATKQRAHFTSRMNLCILYVEH